MSINMINFFNMDSAHNIIYLKGKKCKTYNFSTFDIFTVLLSEASFFCFSKSIFYLPINSDLGCSFLRKPLFRDRLVVLYISTRNYSNPVNTPFNHKMKIIGGWRELHWERVFIFYLGFSMVRKKI